MVIPSNKLKQFTTYAFYEIDRAKEIAVDVANKLIKIAKKYREIKSSKSK